MLEQGANNLSACIGGYSVAQYWRVGIITTNDGEGACVKSAEVKKKLEKDGWELVRINGSHHHFKHPEKPGLVTLPHPKSELAKGNLSNLR
ncbi:type II toxin-antitoxin system HicA family toxin [Marinobacter sp.]|uniref:type II toxin-antitoxin system HicA family toxin n=1 Tax=Marinobacter sp. TaxID=50741 RepID=UPI003A92CD27